MRVAVRVAPRPELAGDGQLALEPLVVGLQVLVGDRPVGGHAVARVDLEVGGVKARRVPGVVDHRAAHAAPAVVLAELDRVLAADDPRLGPVQLVCAGLVGDPVLVGVPERPGLQDQHPPAPPGEALRERRAAGARADDQHVDRLVALVAAHALAPRHARSVRVEQERGVVLGWAQRALQRDAQPLVSLEAPLAARRGTGSTANSGGASQCSRCPGPRRA